MTEQNADLNIKWARVFEHYGSIEIAYFDDKKRWARISDGLDTYDNLICEDNETQEEFLSRVKDFVWEKYLKPTEDRFSELMEK